MVPKQIAAMLWGVVFTQVCACATFGGGGEDGVSAPGNARSGEGRKCDFGGSSDFTCTQGLVCCYPAEGDDPYGRCLPECED